MSVNIKLCNILHLVNIFVIIQLIEESKTVKTRSSNIQLFNQTLLLAVINKRFIPLGHPIVIDVVLFAIPYLFAFYLLEYV